MNPRIAALLRKLERTHELAKRVEMERELKALGYEKPEPQRTPPVERKAPEPVKAVPAPVKEQVAPAPLPPEPPKEADPEEPKRPRGRPRKDGKPAGSVNE